MKKKVIYLMLMLSMVTVLMGCGGSSTYENNLNSGMDKFTSGDYNDMSDDEKAAVNDFLEWQSENY